MKFKFTYQRLLEHYELQEQIARRDFNDSVNTLDKQKEIQKKMYKELDGAVDQIYEARTSPAGTSPSLLLHLDQFVDGQKVRLERQREVIINHTQIVEQKQEILIAAAQQTKTLEKLKEKRRMEFKKLQKKMDAKATDELVVTRFRAGERR